MVQRLGAMENLVRMHVFSDYFVDKKILLTGHTGFKGSWMCHVLHRLGADVHGIALEAKAQSHFFKTNTESFVSHQILNINDRQTTIDTIAKINPEIIIHLAAQPLVRLSYEQPMETLQTNIMGSSYVMEGALQCPNKPILAMITSDKCYENKEQQTGYLETDAMGGYDPYSASKGAAELVIAAYARSFFIPNGQSIVSLRGGNVIGGGDWAQDRIMPDIVTALSNKQKLQLRNPTATRPWQHVLDVINGYLAAIFYTSKSSPGTFESFNIGPTEDNVRDVFTLASAACKIWGADDALEIAKQLDQPHEANFLQLDITKALKRLNWTPIYGFDSAVEQSIAWYQAERDGRNMEEITKDQIAAFYKRKAF